MTTRFLSLRLCAFFFLAWLGCAGMARADDCKATMTDVVFANVSPIAATDVDTSGTLTVSCTFSLLAGIPPKLLFPNVTYCVFLGVGSGGTTGQYRAMASGTARLPYNLYTDTTYAPASVWGGGAMASTAPVSGTITVALALAAVTNTYTISGRIPGSALTGVASGGGDTAAYASNYSADAILSYAFYSGTKPPCTAGTSSTFSFQVRTNVVNDCVVNAGMLNFGPTRVLIAPVRTMGTLGVQCTANASYRISLNGGLNGTTAARRMKNSVTGELIPYKISDTLDGAVWGDGTNGTAPVTAVGTGSVQNLGVYGYVAPQKTPTPGDYRDTVTATIYF
jgi:spore coat protein U-like protein